LSSPKERTIIAVSPLKLSLILLMFYLKVREEREVIVGESRKAVFPCFASLLKARDNLPRGQNSYKVFGSISSLSGC
jgi:hypothetical protein